MPLTKTLAKIKYSTPGQTYNCAKIPLLSAMFCEKKILQLS